MLLIQNNGLYACLNAIKALSLDAQVPLFMLIGAPLEGRIVIVDDVSTAGTSVRESVELIRAHGASPAGVLIALDRMERGQDERSAVREVEDAFGIPVVATFHSWFPRSAGYRLFRAPLQKMLDRFAGVSSDMIEKLSAGAAAVVAAMKPLQQTAEQMSRASSELVNIQNQSQKSTHDLVRASSHLSAAAQTVGNSIHQLGSAAVRFEAVASSASVEANARRQLLISLQDVIDQSQAASREFVKLAHDARKSLDASVEQFGLDVSGVLDGHIKAYRQQRGDSVSSLRLALDQLAVRSARDRH